MASLAQPTCELRALSAFCVGAPQAWGNNNKQLEGLVTGFSPNLFAFPHRLILRLYFSASQADERGQVTKFWPRDCGGRNKSPLPRLAQENCLCEPPFSPSRPAHRVSAPRMTLNPCIEDIAPPSIPQILRAEAPSLAPHQLCIMWAHD